MRQKNKSDTGREPEIRVSDQPAETAESDAGRPAGSADCTGSAGEAETVGQPEAPESDADGNAADAAADAAETAGRLQDELRELGDRHMRLMAEYDNFRRRARQEKDQLYDVTVGDVAADWLPVIDNLERALSAREQSASEADDQILQGIDMVYRQALQVLEKYGVQPIEALGQTFDPNLHAAVLHIDDSAYGDGEIVEVFEKGYIRDGRVLRHSVVKVAN